MPELKAAINRNLPPVGLERLRSLKKNALLTGGKPNNGRKGNLTRYRHYFALIVQDLLEIEDHKHWPYKSYKIVKAIQNAMVEGILRDGFVTIAGLGRFQLHKYSKHYKVKFYPCKSLKRDLDDKEDDGNQGTD